MFDPRSVALVGATDREGSVGRAILENLRRFPGRVFPVNPRRSEVLGIPAFKSITDIPEAVDFYHGVLGFDVMGISKGIGMAFVSAGGYHHHIGLNTWHSKGAGPAPERAPGLYHTAILYPERKDLAVILKRLIDAGYPLTGASDHGVSEAIYLDDPDKNGVELYWDKPKEQWPLDADGNLQMITAALDIKVLLRLAV